MTSHTLDADASSTHEESGISGRELAERVAGRGHGHEGDVYFERGARVERGDTVLDIGANVGAFAASVAARTGSDVTIHCFEPAPQTFEELEENFRKHGPLRRTRHELHRLALTKPELDGTERTFYYFRRFPTDSTLDIDFKKLEFRLFFEKKGREIESSLTSLLGRGGRILGRAVRKPIEYLCREDNRFGVWLAWKVTGMREVPCRLVSLEHFLEIHGIDRVDLMKVDVEGAELDVLEGCRGAWPMIRRVAVESDRRSGRADEVERLLRSQGFQISSCVPHFVADRGDVAQVLILAERVEL